MASSSAQPTVSSIGCPVTEKLGRNNFLLWKPQVMSALWGAQVAHFINPDTPVPDKEIVKAPDKPTEKISNPDYEIWVAKDQQVLNYLLSSISCEILIQVATASTAAEVWTAIQAMFVSQSRGRIINTRMALATAQMGASTIAEHFGKMKTLADDMASAGKRLDDEELASYILAGFDIKFNPVVSAVAARTEPLSLGDLYTQLISFEQRMDLLHGGSSGSSANSATRGGHGGNNNRGNGRARGNGGGCGRGRGGGRHNSTADRCTLVCQLCGKEGHTVIRCYKRFDA